MKANPSRSQSGSDRLYRLAYDEAVRALSEQRMIIDSMRTRVGLLLSVSAIATSFLGAQALEEGRPSLPAWTALVAFAGVGVFSLAILWPRRWEFSASPRYLIRNWAEAESPPPIEDVHRDLSLHMHSSYLENRTGIDRLAALFQIASALLTVEVILWITAIAWTG